MLSEAQRRQWLWSLALYIKERMSSKVQSNGLRRYNPLVRVR